MFLAHGLVYGMARLKQNELAQSNGHPTKKDQSTQESNEIVKTDYSRWRLLDVKGRQTWHYLDNDEETNDWPQSIADKYHLGLPTACFID